MQPSGADDESIPFSPEICKAALMSLTPTTGNAADVTALEPDAHGQAALLLAESTLHTLVDNATITSSQAGETARTAAEVKREVATLAGESRGRMEASLTLLNRIADSFEVDGPA